VAAGSADDAIKKLKEQIKELAKKPNRSEKDKVLQKVLEGVIKDLEKIDESGKRTDAKVAKLNAERKMVVRFRDVKDQADTKLSAEQKAKIEKARAQVKELSAALQTKQKELAEAQARLAKLQGALAAYRVEYQPVAVIDRLTSPKNDVLASPGAEKVERRVTVTRDVDTGKTVRRTIAVPAEKLAILKVQKAESDQNRIDKLEKRLAELLEEVAKLKKDRAK
jgi:chromosome segregation ATPase